MSRRVILKDCFEDFLRRIALLAVSAGATVGGMLLGWPDLSWYYECRMQMNHVLIAWGDGCENCVRNAGV